MTPPWHQEQGQQAGSIRLGLGGEGVLCAGSLESISFKCALKPPKQAKVCMQDMKYDLKKASNTSILTSWMNSIEFNLLITCISFFKEGTLHILGLLAPFRSTSAPRWLQRLQPALCRGTWASRAPRCPGRGSVEWVVGHGLWTWLLFFAFWGCFFDAFVFFLAFGGPFVFFFDF